MRGPKPHHQAARLIRPALSPSGARAGRSICGLSLAGLLLAASGCYQEQEVLPYGISSLAVLPAEVQPSNAIAGRHACDHLVAKLVEQNSYRVVGIDSASRIFNAPEGSGMFQRFRTMALTAGVVEPTVSQAIGNRLGVQGLLYPRIGLALSGPSRGMLTLSIAVYEANLGYRVWQGFAQHSFSGNPGENGFNQTLDQLVNTVIDQMPRARGEDPDPNRESGRLGEPGSLTSPLIANDTSRLPPHF